MNNCCPGTNWATGAESGIRGEFDAAMALLKLLEDRSGSEVYQQACALIQEIHAHVADQRMCYEQELRRRASLLAELSHLKSAAFGRGAPSSSALPAESGNIYDIRSLLAHRR